MLATKPQAARTMTFTPNGDPTSPAAGYLEITARGETVGYVVTEQVADGGRGFTVAKMEECYDVFVCGKGAAGDRCTCPAATYGRRCKHRDGLRKLVEMRKL